MISSAKNHYLFMEAIIQKQQLSLQIKQTLCFHKLINDVETVTLQKCIKCGKVFAGISNVI